MQSQYTTENDLGRHESHTLEVSDVRRGDGDQPDMAFRRLHQPASYSPFAGGGAAHEREHIEARYTTDCIQEVPETARSREFNQTTDRPMMNFPKEERNGAEAQPFGGMSKEQVDAEIEKYDRKHQDADEAGSDAFK